MCIDLWWYIIGISSSDAATFGLGAMQVAMTGIATTLVDRSGRRMLLIVSIKRNLLLSYSISTITYLSLKKNKKLKSSIIINSFAAIFLCNDTKPPPRSYCILFGGW